MNTEKNLKEILSAFEETIKGDQKIIEYSEALGEFKKMLAEGLTKPRGNQLEDAMNRSSYSTIHQQV